MRLKLKCTLEFLQLTAGAVFAAITKEIWLPSFFKRICGLVSDKKSKIVLANKKSGKVNQNMNFSDFQISFSHCIKHKKRNSTSLFYCNLKLATEIFFSV